MDGEVSGCISCKVSLAMLRIIKDQKPLRALWVKVIIRSDQIYLLKISFRL